MHRRLKPRAIEGQGGFKRETLRDLAKKLGLSVSTVSRALNNHPRISTHTVSRVRRIAEKSGYVRNNVARGLALRRSCLIGLIVSDISNPFFSEISRGVHDAAQRESYVVALCNTGRSAEKEAFLSRTLLENQAEGLIFAGGTTGEQHLEELRQKNIPFVMAGRRSDHLRVPTVAVDNFAVGYQATQYLAGLGHTEIMFVSGPSDSSTSRDRERGYLHALRASRLAPRIVRGDFKMETGFSLAPQLMEDKKRPSAVFAVNDLVAIGLILGLTNLGLRIPGDLAVVGCDDLPMARLIKPKLTTIKIPMYEIGARAMEMLMAQLRGRPDLASPSNLLGSDLIVRESAG